MEFINPLDANKWRALLEDFDRKRIEFSRVYGEMKTRPAPTPALEATRQALLRSAKFVQSEVDKLHAAAVSVRNWLRSFGNFFGFGTPSQTMGALGFAPLAIAIGIGAAAIIVAQIADWLKKAAQYNAQVKIAASVQKAGGSATDITAALRGGQPKEQPKLFGMDMGALKWVAIIGGIVLAGPFILKELERRR